MPHRMQFTSAKQFPFGMDDKNSSNNKQRRRWRQGRRQVKLNWCWESSNNETVRIINRTDIYLCEKLCTLETICFVDDMKIINASFDPIPSCAPWAYGVQPLKIDIPCYTCRINAKIPKSYEYFFIHQWISQQIVCVCARTQWTI